METAYALLTFPGPGILLYWAPLVLCLWGYSARTWRNFRIDVKRREEALGKTWGCYVPSDTVGTVLGRLLLSVCPVANILAAIVDVGPEVFSRVLRFCGDVLDIPLVPNKPQSEVRSTRTGGAS